MPSISHLRGLGARFRLVAWPGAGTLGGQNQIETGPNFYPRQRGKVRMRGIDLSNWDVLNIEASPVIVQRMLLIPTP